MKLRWFLYGLLAHLIFGWALFFFAPQHNKPTEKLRVPLSIHLREKAPIEIKAKYPSTSVLSVPASLPHENRQLTVRPSTSSQATYSDLLPRATSGQIALPTAREAARPSLIEGHQFRAGTSGLTKQNLAVDASILSAALDVPLKARRISSGSEAFARIHRIGPRRIRLVDLRGDPMLRAVIFENLKEPRVVALILKLLDELDVDSLPLSLQALSVPTKRMQDETDFTWIGRKLVIRKSAPRKSRASSGAVTLPDPHAEKAIIQDRLEMERFQSSAAYRSAIRHFDIDLD